MVTKSGASGTSDDIELENLQYMMNEEHELSLSDDEQQPLQPQPSSMHSASRLTKASDKQKKVDDKIARWRSVVETTFALIKAFLALSNRYITSRHVSSVQNLIKIICSVVNHNLEQGVSDEEEEM